MKKQLKNRSGLLGDGVSRAFLRAIVHLIGGYREALKFVPGEVVTFDEKAFIETRPSTSQPFLKNMLQLQIFQQVNDKNRNVKVPVKTFEFISVRGGKIIHDK